MADTEDVVVVEDDLEFEKGYGEPTVTPPAKTTPETPPEETLEEDPPEEAPPEVAPPADPAPEVKYHQLTEDQWAEMQALSTQVTSIRADHAKRLDTAFGKVGGLERTLQQLQQATPAGFTVDITDDIVAEISEEFPELGKRTLAAFKQFASKLKGTGPATVAPVDTAEVETRLQAEVKSLFVASQIEALDDAHPTWREVTGAPDSKTPYREWLTKQPAEYQQKLASTNSATVISNSIDRFTKDAAAAKAAEEAKPKEPPVSTRKQQLAAAAVTKGAGGRAPAATDDDDFEAGYNSA